MLKKIFFHRLVISFLIILLFVFLNSQGWLRTVKDFFWHFSQPSQEIIYQFSLKATNWLKAFSSAEKLREENHRLVKENERLAGESALLEEEMRENKFLRQQLSLENELPVDLILAHIFARDSQSGRHFFINQGSRQGIQEKDIVITAGNLLVGQVVETTASFSKIRLIVDSSSRINGLIQETRVSGLVRGDQELGLVIDLLPSTEEIQTDQSVITSGLAGFFPTGLLIGRIKEVISNQVQTCQLAKIEAAVDFNKLEQVFVLK